MIAAVLLDMKPTLHGWLRLIEHRELTAALQLLVLSVVILPNLPSVGLGPYHALNPYQLWWAVILIASLSMVGHVAMRITGAQRGILWTGLLGGLASSTAATLALARFARLQPSLEGACAAGAWALRCDVLQNGRLAWRNPTRPPRDIWRCFARDRCCPARAGVSAVAAILRDAIQ